MGQLVFLLGRSGTGKSYSMRNFPPEKLAVVNVQGKIFPFRGAGKIKTESTDTSEKIVKKLKEFAKDGFKSIVVDDFQYVMANEFMRRSTERGYDKFTDIGRHAWDIANTVQELPQDVIVYVMCHTDRDDEGNEKIKTIGKLLDEKICLEGMSTIVLKTNVTDGVYSFLTQNSGKDTVKSPAGMFPTYAVDNDLYYVDKKIRNYYQLGEFLSDEDMEEIDEVAKKVEVIKDEVEGKKRRSARRKKVDENVEKDVEGQQSEQGNVTGNTTRTRRGRRSTEKNGDNDGVAEKSAADESSAGDTAKPKRRSRGKVDTDTGAEAQNVSDESVSDEAVNEENFQGEDESLDQGTVDGVSQEGKPKRKSRKTREQVATENTQKIVEANIDESGEKEEIPYDEAEEPQMERLPRKVGRKKSKEEPAMGLPGGSIDEPVTPNRRRRKKA